MFNFSNVQIRYYNCSLSSSLHLCELLLQARGELLKLKNVVKLQAAIRGYLVRKHAVETLRCIKAIIKLQALVRARCARLALEQSHSEELDVKRTEDSNTYKTLVTQLNPDLILTFQNMHTVLGFRLQTQLQLGMEAMLTK